MPSRDLKVTLIGQDRTQSAFKSAAGGAQGLSDKFGRLGVIAGGALAGVGFAKFAKDSVTAGASFDATLRQMSAVAGVPQAQLKQLSTLALKMGADTKFSAQQAADAMLSLAKGGLTTAQIKGGALASTLTLAAAGGIELGVAGDVMATALNTFGLEAGKASQVAAALAGGASASTASVESLAQGLGNIGPVARGVGMSIQDTVGALSALDQAGIKGAEGGTALRSMLNGLTPSSIKAKDEIKKLGLEFTNADGTFRSTAQIAQELQDKMGKLAPATRAAAMETIFGTYGQQAANVLMTNGAKGLETYIKATKDQGAAQRIADATMKGTAGALEQLSGSWDTLKTRAGLASGEVITKFALMGTAILNGIPGLVGKVTTALEPIRKAIGDFFTSLAGKRQASDTAFEIANGLTLPPSAATRIGMSIKAAIDGGIGSVDVKAVASKLGAIVSAALGKIATGAVELTAALGRIINKVDWGTLAVQIGKKAPAVVLGFAIGLLNVDFGAMIKVLANNWAAALIGVITIFLAPVRIVGAFAGLLAKIPLVGSFLSWMVLALKGFIDGIGGPIAGALRSIGSKFSEGLGISGLGARMIGAAKESFTFFFFRIKYYGTVWAQGAVEATGKLAAALGKGVKFAFQQMGMAAKDAATGFAGSMGGLLVAAGKLLITGLIKGIKSAFGAVKDTLGKLTGMLPDWKGPASVDATLLFDNGVTIINGLVSGMQSRFPSVRDSLAGLTSAIPSMVSGVDFAGARHRANQTGVGRAEAGRDSAAGMFTAAGDAAKAATVANNAADASADKTEATFARLSKRLADIKTATAQATKAATDHARALRDKAQAAQRAADAMPSVTKAQRAAKDAALAHAKALRDQSVDAFEAATRIREHGIAAVKAATDAANAAEASAKRQRDAANGTASAAQAASAAVAQSNADLIKAQADLADAVYAEASANAAKLADKAGEALDALVAKAQALRDAFSQGVLAGTELGSIFQKGQDGAIASFEEVLASLTDTLSAAETFSQQIGALAGLGLSAELLEQVAKAGPKLGGQLATSILSAGPEGIAKLNKLFEDIQRTAKTGVDAVAASLYGPGAAALSNYVAGLRSVFPELDGVLAAVQAKVAAIMGAKAQADALAAALDRPTVAAAPARPAATGTAPRAGSGIGGPFNRITNNYVRVTGAPVEMNDQTVSTALRRMELLAGTR